MNESDPRSDVHYLGSSENKAYLREEFNMNIFDILCTHTQR